MGVCTHLSLGWFVEIESNKKYYKQLEKLEPKWDDFIYGIDPMCGRLNHICIINGFNKDIVNDDTTVISLMNNKIPDKIPDKIQQFISEYKNMFGEDSIRLDYGLIQWYS